MRKEVKEAIRELCKRTKDIRNKNYKYKNGGKQK
jgi:hypothetical protein